MSGHKIIEGLKDAISGKYGRLTIDGSTWVPIAAVANERERCAKIAENPGFIEARDTDWDLGVNYAKKFIAEAIRRQE